MGTKPHPVFDGVELEFCTVCQKWVYEVCFNPDRCGHPEPPNTVTTPTDNDPYGAAP